MRRIVITFIVTLVLFTIFSSLVILRTVDGTLDLCVYKFEECMMGDGNSSKIKNTFDCSIKNTACSAKGLYQSFFDIEGLDNDYNDYMQEKLKQEIKVKEELDKLNSNMTTDKKEEVKEVNE